MVRSSICLRAYITTVTTAFSRGQRNYCTPLPNENSVKVCRWNSKYTQLQTLACFSYHSIKCLNSGSIFHLAGTMKVYTGLYINKVESCCIGHAHYKITAEYHGSQAVAVTMAASDSKADVK